MSNLAFSVKTIQEALDHSGIEHEIDNGKIIMKGKIASVKTKLNKALKELYKYKIVTSKNGYFGEFEFKHTLQNYTIGGFDMKENNGKVEIYESGGTGYKGID